MALCFSICGSSKVRSLSYWVMPTGYILWKINKYLECLRFALIFQKVWSNSDSMFSSWDCQNAKQTSLNPENLFPPNLSVLLMAFWQEFIPVSKPLWVEVRAGGGGVRKTLKKSFKKRPLGTPQFREVCPLLYQFLKVAGKCPKHIFKWFKTIKYYNENLSWENMWKSQRLSLPWCD